MKNFYLSLSIFTYIYIYYVIYIHIEKTCRTGVGGDHIDISLGPDNIVWAFSLWKWYDFMSSRLKRLRIWRVPFRTCRCVDCGFETLVSIDQTVSELSRDSATAGFKLVVSRVWMPNLGQVNADLTGSTFRPFLPWSWAVAQPGPQAIATRSPAGWGKQPLYR